MVELILIAIVVIGLNFYPISLGLWYLGRKIFYRGK